MAPIDTEPTRMSTRLVEKRRELACQESSDKPVLEKRSGDEKTNGESSLAKANSGIVIKITNTDNEDYYIEGGDEEEIGDYDDAQSLDKDDAEAIEEDEESDDEEDGESFKRRRVERRVQVKRDIEVLIEGRGKKSILHHTPLQHEYKRDFSFSMIPQQVH